MHDQNSDLFFYLPVEGPLLHLQLKNISKCPHPSTQTLRGSATPGEARVPQPHTLGETTSQSPPIRVRIQETGSLVCETGEETYKCAKGGWQVSLPKEGGAPGLKKYQYNLRPSSGRWGAPRGECPRPPHRGAKQAGERGWRGGRLQGQSRPGSPAAPQRADVVKLRAQLH